MRAMVTVVGFWKYNGPFDVFLQRLRDHIVIDTPSLVVGSGIGPVAPPGIIVWFLVEMSEGIHKTAIDKVPDPLALYR